MTRRLYLALALGFSLLMVCAQGVLAYGTEKRLTSTFEEGALLAAGDYKAYVVHLTPEDKMRLTFKVTMGEEIDIYTMSWKDFVDYKAGAMLVSYYSQYSKENLKYFEYSGDFKPAQEGDYVIVVDNLAKTSTGATGATDIVYNVKVDLQFKAPFPWLPVIATICILSAVVVVVMVVVWMRKKRADIAEMEAQKKRAEAAKIRPIFINPQGPAAPGVPAAGASPSLQAPPPSSSCKSCPHIYDPTSANCIACEYR